MSQDLNQFSPHTRERPARRLKGGVRPLGSRVQVFLIFFEKIFGPQLLHDFLYHFLSKKFDFEPPRLLVFFFQEMFFQIICLFVCFFFDFLIFLIFLIFLFFAIVSCFFFFCTAKN